MAIKSTKLGGVDYTTPTARIKPTDLNDTNDETIKSAIVGQTQIPFSILKSAGAFTNEGNLCADRTTDSNGANNTINTGSSTAYFDTDKYILNFADESSSGTTHDPDTFTNPTNAFDGNDTTYADKTNQVGTFTLGKTFTPQTYQLCKVVCIASVRNASSGATESVGASLQKFDGSTWTSIQTLFSVSSSNSINTGSFNGVVDISSHTNIQGLRVALSCTDGGITEYVRLNTLEYGNYTDSTIISDEGTLTLTGDEKMISVYNSATIPTDTSMKVQLSDESQTISAEHALTANGTTLIPITTAPTADDVLKLTFTLETTDTAVTLSWYGYGCYRYKGD